MGFQAAPVVGVVVLAGPFVGCCRCCHCCCCTMTATMTISSSVCSGSGSVSTVSS